MKVFFDSNVFLHHLAGTSQKATELLERVESDEIYWVNRSPSNSAATFLSYYREFENMEVIEILRRIERKLEKIDEKIENFMGLCELSEEELELIDKDIEAYERGELELIDLEDAKRILNV